MKDSQKQKLRKLQKILRNSGIEKSIEDTTRIRGYHDFSSGYRIGAIKDLDDNCYYAWISIEKETCDKYLNVKKAIKHIIKLLKNNNIKFEVSKNTGDIFGIKL